MGNTFKGKYKFSAWQILKNNPFDSNILSYFEL